MEECGGRWKELAGGLPEVVGGKGELLVVWQVHVEG